jgi:hypothetical protein
VRYCVRCKTLPLAIYSEVAAHLMQVDGVSTELMPSSAQTFNYADSQVGGLWIQLPDRPSPHCQTQIEQILAYYSARYSPWEKIDSDA